MYSLISRFFEGFLAFFLEAAHEPFPLDWELEECRRTIRPGSVNYSVSVRDGK
jgi:hypothetical protein